MSLSLSPPPSKGIVSRIILERARNEREKVYESLFVNVPWRIHIVSSFLSGVIFANGS